MSSLIDTLRSRGTHLAKKTRDRSIDVLGLVRDGTLDWHRTLEARRTELSAPKWFQLGGLQIFVIDRFDRALSAFGDRVRVEIGRLQHLELESATADAEQRIADTKAPKEQKAKAKPAKAKPAKANPAKAKPAKAKAKTRAAAKRSKPTRRFVMPIAGYDELTAKEVIGEVHRLTPAQCETVRSHEASHKKRKTVLSALAAQLAS